MIKEDNQKIENKLRLIHYGKENIQLEIKGTKFKKNGKNK